MGRHSRRGPAPKGDARPARGTTPPEQGATSGGTGAYSPPGPYGSPGQGAQGASGPQGPGPRPTAYRGFRTAGSRTGHRRVECPARPTAPPPTASPASPTAPPGTAYRGPRRRPSRAAGPRRRLGEWEGSGADPGYAGPAGRAAVPLPRQRQAPPEGPRGSLGPRGRRGPRQDYLDAFDEGDDVFPSRPPAATRPASVHPADSVHPVDPARPVDPYDYDAVTDWRAASAARPPAGTDDAAPPTGTPAQAKGAKGRAFTGIAAAAVTTVLAVVVAGQVAEGGADRAQVRAAHPGVDAARSRWWASPRSAPGRTPRLDRPARRHGRGLAAARGRRDPHRRARGTPADVGGSGRPGGRAYAECGALAARFIPDGTGVWDADGAGPGPSRRSAARDSPAPPSRTPQPPCPAWPARSTASPATRRGVPPAARRCQRRRRGGRGVGGTGLAVPPRDPQAVGEASGRCCVTQAASGPR
ncbi:hypothetical protein SHIRM173S_03062 [Streptomyces hirsutus]